MIVPSLDILANVRVNQWVAHLPEDHPLAQQHRALLGATAPITWTSSFNRHLAVCNGLRLLLARGYDTLHHIKDDDLKLLSARWSKGTDARSTIRTLLRRRVFSDAEARLCPPAGNSG